MDDQRAAEGVDHLQTAARELLAAARLFLDAVEDVIDEPERVTHAMAGVVDLFKDFSGRRTQPWERHAWTEPADATGAGASKSNPAGPEDPAEEPQTEGVEADDETAATKPAAKRTATRSATRRPGGGASDESGAPVSEDKESGAKPSAPRKAAKRTPTKVKRISVD